MGREGPGFRHPARFFAPQGALPQTLLRHSVWKVSQKPLIPRGAMAFALQAALPLDLFNSLLVQKRLARDESLSYTIPLADCICFR